MSIHINTTALERDLRARIKGEVRFDDGSRALYATDSSNYRQAPLGVVLPRDAEDVIAAVATARRYAAPVLPRGGGTSLAGQTCNTGVVLDMSKHYHRVLEIDPVRKQARVQPGCVLDNLRDAAEQHGLTFGPDPATHSRCTLGGMIGNNSCGVHSVLAGKTDDNVDELEVLTYDGLRLRVGATSEDELEAIIREGGRRGDIYRRLKELRDRYAPLIRDRFPDIPRRVSGFGLDWLLPEKGFNVARALVGTEGTCVTVLEATLRLVTSPRYRTLVVLGYPDIYTACDHVPEIMGHHPIGLEGFDDQMVDFMRKKRLDVKDLGLLPEGGGWLLVEFGGRDADEAAGRAHGLIDALGENDGAPHAKFYDDRPTQARIWKVRESALGATAIVPGLPETWPGWEDSAVPPERLGAYLRDLRGLINEFGYIGSFYGHFGQGCLHVRFDFDFKTRAGIDRYLAFIDRAADLVVGYGGSLSGEHGDGQARAALLPKMYGDELVQAFREFKAIWDPEGKMNPGKVVDPYAPDENLRLGVTYEPWQPQTHFHFPDDGGSFSQATLRCVGVSACRREAGGVMCPSYQVTHEEMHSTRGRARLLFEMLQGQDATAIIGKHGWRDEHVKEALDLCLACKGCKGDCPVNVDMATYKAEFLSHYYEGRLRPRSAYAFGLIFRWARLASLAPGVANFFTQTPGLSAAAKLAAGIAPQRQAPAFAAQSFQAWFRGRAKNGDSTPAGDVILWPDTFNNYFHPETARAAVEVLEAAGCRVIVPQAALCCGRPLYDYGMLDQAKRQLQEILIALREPIRAGVPVVGLEPSCVSVFRDELVNLLGGDEDARRLAGQTYTLAEFLQQRAPHFKPPRLERAALFHGHCHQKSVLDMDAEEAVLDQMGVQRRAPDPGCCGMAGAFGFEAGEHYEVSVKAGERVLLPAVREASGNTLIVADGFSCREQIRQGAGREALHLAQVIQMALHEGPAGPSGDYPERGCVGQREGGGWRGAALLVAPVLAGALLAAWARRRR